MNHKTDSEPFRGTWNPATDSAVLNPQAVSETPANNERKYFLEIRLMNAAAQPMVAWSFRLRAFSSPQSIGPPVGLRVFRSPYSGSEPSERGFRH